MLNEEDLLPLLREYEVRRGFKVEQFDHTKVCLLIIYLPLMLSYTNVLLTVVACLPLFSTPQLNLSLIFSEVRASCWDHTVDV